MIRSLLISMRPHQWTKNLFVLAAPLFARELARTDVLRRSLLALGLFCLAASGVYLMNDLADRERDREHPRKRRRPIAAGTLSVSVALSAALALIAVALGLGTWLSRSFGGLMLLYIAIQVAYSFWLRRAVILDVFCIASGFVIRIVSGAIVASVELSPWLILTTIFLSLFLALCKRRAEVESLGQGRGSDHRETLEEYSIGFLDQLISISTAAVVLCYSLYTLDERTLALVTNQSYKLVFTVPFVIFGIFRYLFLVHRREGGGSPIEAFARDRPLAANAVLWAATVVVVLYYL